MLAAHQRLELVVKRRPGIADQRAPHCFAIANNELGQARDNQVRVTTQVHVRGSGNDIIDDQWHALRAQDRRDLPDIDGTQQGVAGNLAKTRRQRLPAQKLTQLALDRAQAPDPGAADRAADC